jgi:hypothetical protein
MKKYLMILVAALVSTNALAYVSLQGNDPNLGAYDSEYKSAVKSETALYSDAISKGHGLYYDENSYTGLYKVSRYSVLTYNAAAATPFIAGIAGRAVATGDVAAFPLVTRGYVDYAVYDATSPIAVGGYLCVGTAASVKGVLVGCDSGVTSGIVSLEAKASGTGSDLKVKLDLQ